MEITEKAKKVTYTKGDPNVVLFVAALDKRINALFKDGDKVLSKKGGRKLHIKTWVIGFWLVLAYTSILASHQILIPLVAVLLFYVVLVLLYLLLGFVMALIGFNVMHDASHGAYSEDKRVNKILSYSLNLIGGIIFFWNIKHNTNHHTDTNVFGYDEDIDLYPLLRIHESQKYLWFHKYQHRYAKWLYLLSGPVIVHVNDFRKAFTRKIGTEREKFDFPTKEKWIFGISKVLHFALFIGVPGFFIGFKAATLLYLFMLCITGFIMSLVFQLAHLFEQTRFELDPEVEYEWHVYQLLTTADFAVKSKFWTWVLGGLNFQAIHHLYRRISHEHYPKMQKIVEETCLEFNIVYYNIPTFYQAYKSHTRLLKKFSKPPVTPTSAIAVPAYA